MKKAPFPIWNITSIALIIIFMVGFYLNGKLNLNYTWKDDWVKISFYGITFFWTFFNAGIESNKITEYINQVKKMRGDKHHALYEYLREYLTKYKDSENPKIEVLKNTLLIRLIHLDTNKSIEIITDEFYKNYSLDDRNIIVSLNMLIDHWIEEFVKEEEEKRKKENYRIKSTEQPIEISQENQFNTISFLLTNVCLENINKNKVQKF